MSAQDDVRENRMVDLFNLERPENRTRHGVDAVLRIDGRELEFELKSITTGGGLTTVRDFGRDHIEKWRTKHWLVSVYTGSDLTLCRYGSPEAMRPWIEGRWEYIRPDFELAKLAPARLTLEDMYAVLGEKAAYTVADARKLHKMQYSAAQYSAAMGDERHITPERMLTIFRDRLRYVIERGSTLNNPKVSPQYLASWPAITSNHAEALRTLVREWMTANPG
ncbi:MAG: hypothetical protein ACI8U3_001284 [Brevundimonas sp.]|uniref:hypothetical protein n=1 Tax=Brevundimonas sp. TaxID=1871086 RepID=UPI0039E3A0E5